MSPQNKIAVVAGRIGGVIFAKRLPTAVAFSWDIPHVLVEQWNNRTNQILMVEAVAPLIALRTSGPWITDRAGMFFSDNQVVESVLVNGYSNSAKDLNMAIGTFWDKVRELNMCFWIARIPTDMNPSDGASTGELEQDCHQYGWEMVQPCIPEEWTKLCVMTTKRHTVAPPSAHKNAGPRSTTQSS